MQESTLEVPTQEQSTPFAVEMRKRVIDQMAVMKPGEFQDVSFECEVSS